MQPLRAVPVNPSRGAAPGVAAAFTRSTSFLGRDREVSALREMLLRKDVRLVTVVGPPGVGKTSLAKVTAGTLAGEFADGLTFVDLSPVRDAALVVTAVAQAVGMSDAGGRPAGALAEYLRDADTLLVLDNLEQVIECAASLVDLMRRCPGVKVLATSREPLHLDMERQHPLRPLLVPDLAGRIGPADLARVPATALFIDRARMVQPEFALTEASAAAVAEICVRLDGLPLAIEMAAAQVKFVTPEAMARELARSSNSLAAPARNVPDRHRTLRACIGWSYELLPPAEQALLRAVSVFRGGFTPEAAEAVASGEAGPRVRETLRVLVDKSLLEMVPQPDATARFALLESIREFALEHLDAQGGTRTASQRHAEYFLALAHRADTLLHGADQDAWAGRLTSDNDNFRAALEWAIEAANPVLAADLGWALHWFWYAYGHNREGREWLARVLLSAGALTERARGRVLAAAGVLAWSIGNHGEADRWLDEAVRCLSDAGDEEGLARALHYFGHVLDLVRGDPRAALAAFEESIEMFRRLGDAWGVSFSLNCSGLALAGLGDFERAVARMEEAHAGYQRLGDRRMLAWARADLGGVLSDHGDLARANRYLQNSAAVLRAAGTSVRLMWAVAELGDIAVREHDHLRALSFYKEYMILARELGSPPEVALAIGDIGAAAWSLRPARDAARFIAAAERLHRVLESQTAKGALSGGAPSKRRQFHQQTAAEIRRALGSDFESAWQEGETADLDDIIEDALAFEPDRRGQAEGRADEGPLSPREREVAALIAQGLSNREIARTLLIGHRTVATHVQGILNKLGLDRRSQIAAWAVARGLHTPAS
ncbi:MAG TPA: tetratricopeptide repeat protein [bacterium]|nr:tetratricopeptide repeat protein [bacterium]